MFRGKNLNVASEASVSRSSAPRDQTVKGAASVLAQMDARIRVEGASEKDRGSVRREAALILAVS